MKTRHEALEKELTPEQYQKFLEIEDELGIEEAVNYLPERESDTVTTIAHVSNGILKKLRVGHGLTQNDLANILDVSRQKYNCFERDGYNVSFSRLSQIAIFYNISLDCLSGFYTEYKPFYPDMKPLESNVLRFIIKNKDISKGIPNTREIFNEIFEFIRK